MTFFMMLSAEEQTGGTYVVTLRVSPSARHDNTPWIQIRIEEAATIDGEWATLVTANLTPTDDDPTNPQAREITLRGATLPAGWYRVTFLDAGGRTETHPATYSGVRWAPTVQDVANESPAYLRVIGETGHGEPLYGFNENTDPTAAEVRGRIATAVQEVASRVGVPNTRLEQFADLARTAATWHAAAGIEAQKSPEGTQRTEAGYAWKQASYVACLNELIAQARAGSLRLV